MPHFVYTALSQTGMLTSGEGVAATAEELIRELAGRGLLVQRVRPKRAKLLSIGRREVKPDEFLLFNQELLALLRAGLTIPEALKLSVDRPDAPNLGRTLGRVLEHMRGGALFSEACTRHPEVFDPLYISTLRTGEKTGDLPKVLGRYQEYLRHREVLRKKVSRALAYPMFLLIAVAVILAVLFMFVMPRFVAMYADFGARLPWATRVLIGVVESLPWVLPVIALAATGGWFAWRRWVATDAGRLTVDRVKERLPYIGEIQRTLAVTQLARSLSTLLSGGTPLVEALRTAQGAVGNRAYGARLLDATEQVTHGTSLAKAIRATGLVPETAVKMIEVGEASGNLEGMLAEVAQFYDEKLDNRMAQVMTLIEPLLMLVMGVLIGGIIVVMYLPIFNMAEVIK